MISYQSMSTKTLGEALRQWVEERGCAKLDKDYDAMIEIQVRIDAIKKELDMRRDPVQVAYRQRSKN